MSRAAAARHFSPPLRGHSSELSNTDNLPRPQLLLLYHRSSKNSHQDPRETVLFSFLFLWL